MTKIEWTNETWNPIVGCSKVSPGCDNCYAEKMAGRLSNIPATYDNYNDNYSKVVRWGQHPKKDDYYGLGQWNGKTHFIKSAIDKPIYWKKPRMIFVCSMGDLFHESVPFEWIDKVFTVMAYASRHTFQMLTKRPERMMEYINSDETRERLSDSILNASYPIKGNIYDPREKYGWPLQNVWLGVTAENQKQADKRIRILIETKAVKRFVSIEPMLGIVDLSEYYFPYRLIKHVSRENRTKIIDLLDWVICGGESGSKARPMHPDWVRSLRDQCEDSKTPFFFKQWGEYIPSYSAGMNSESLDQWMQKFGNAWVKRSFKFPDGMVVVKVGRKQAGSKIDGIEHKQIPSWK